MRHLTKITAIAAVLLTGAASAQPDGEGAAAIVETCRTETSDAARIACLERAIYRLTADPAPQEEPVSPSAAVTAEPPAVTGIGAEQVESRIERENPAPREEADAAAERANVIGFARNVRGKLILVLDNGQVWAQRESDDEDVVLVVGEVYPVEIGEGFMSGYRMRFLDQRRILRVERLR